MCTRWLVVESLEAMGGGAGWLFDIVVPPIELQIPSVPSVLSLLLHGDSVLSPMFG